MIDMVKLAESICLAPYKIMKEEKMSKMMLQENWEKEYNYAGSFQTALMKLIELADNENLTKLEREYPDVLKAYRKFSGR